MSFIADDQKSKPTIDLKENLLLMCRRVKREVATCETHIDSFGANNNKSNRFVIRKFCYLSVFFDQLDANFGTCRLAWNHKWFVLLANYHRMFVVLNKQMIGI